MTGEVQKSTLYRQIFNESAYFDSNIASPLSVIFAIYEQPRHHRPYNPVDGAHSENC